ncbi:MAG: arginine--tRNA ligase [Actinobacteria bacterium BACL4 MAG-120820-bin23]|jgi:arginyl-tRNA synthetase|nr:MAG: arginine--tRNA ligase [Actinobacteria bacterium BACL4 MAG-120820-bin23]KRO51624.1 MAG: arginine--tRNA ligase [Actinobacteria bacterium BACL4 MAG-121001-bin59]KRO77085.1 MAG: arginine--tRNA ligase [Actinobacteria bacterium BACL4 MAG-120920-bin74]KRO93118.1 MAG: arginine--tRNA ligase [Actinobacteria bacterium BACL4 MAG-120507-bin0]
MSADSVQSEVAAAIHKALEIAKKSNLLQCQIPAQIILERPKNRDHGDYATSIALTLAKQANLQPRVIAQVIIDSMSSNNLLAPAGISKTEIAGPGFINITLATASQAAIIPKIISAGKEYGSSNLLVGKKINLEFVSANPTGPLHLGHTRWAAVGDSLGRVLSAAGAEVTREFYVNDRGNQMDLFGASIRAAALNQPRPEAGYHGEYIEDLANQIQKSNPDLVNLPESESIAAFRDAGYKLQLAQQNKVLDNFGTHFDVWFSEKALYENNFFDHSLSKLKAQGHVYELEGAIWLRTTDFGDDKDRVMIKSDGSFAYFASDSAYYMSKRERGFNLCIYMLGADHHGYVGRIKAIAACAGDDKDKDVEILIGQMVKIIEGGEEIKLSKRAGTIITLEELVEKVGKDAARYTLIRFPTDTPMVMDVDLLRKNTNENPVYYVQYAHARICAVLRNAKDYGINYEIKSFNPELLVHERERELIGLLAEFPRVVSAAAQAREPHRVARYIEDLASQYHRFYNDCRVLPLGDEKPTELNSARATLCLATAQVISNGLDLLGVSAPEKM